MNRKLKLGLSFLVSLLIFPASILGLEDVVSVIESGFKNEDINAYTTWYGTTTHSGMKTANECKKLGGTYDSSKVKYKFVANVMKCSVTPSSTSGYDYCRSITFATSHSSYCIDAQKFQDTVTCFKDNSNASFTYKYRYKDLKMVSLEKEKYVVYSDSEENINLYKGTVMSWKKADETKYYSCSWEEENTKLGEAGPKRITQQTYATTDGDTAYCVHPGRPFKEQNYKLVNSWNVSNCKNSKDADPYCGLAAIVQEVELNYGGDYVTANTALRLWASLYLKDEGDADWWDAASNKLYTQANLYKTTAGYILKNGYSGSTNRPEGVYGVLYGNSTSFNNGIAVFKKAEAGIEMWSSSIKVISPTEKIDPTKGPHEIVLETNFNEKTKIELGGVTATNNAVVKSFNLDRCEGSENKYCLKVVVDTTTVNSNFNINIKYDHPGDVISKVGYYQSASGGNWQNMIIYEKQSEASALVEIAINIPICVCVNPTTCFDHLGRIDLESYEENCLPDELCEDTKIKYNMPEDCDDDGTTGTIKDPSICTILNADETTQKNYNYTEAYGNEYCDVFCRDTLEFTFMERETALAGRYFKHDVYSKYSNIAYLSTVILSSRQCTSLIDYDSWKAAYETANELVRTTWNEYKKTESQNLNAVAHPETDRACKTCSGSSCCTKDHSVCTPPVTCGKDEEGCTPHGWIHGNHCESGDGCGARYRSWTWYTWAAYYNETGADGRETKIDVSGSDGSSNFKYDSCSCSGCGTCAGDSGSKVSIASKPYYDTVAEREELIDKIESCNYYEGSSTYNGVLEYRPSNDVDIDYDENTVYNQRYEISIANDATPSYVTRRGYSLEVDWEDFCLSCTDDLGSLGESKEEHLTYWECTGSELTAECHDVETKMFPINKTATVVVERETIHYQESSFYTQVYTGAVSTSKNGIGYWIPMDDYAYPVDKTRISGTYGIDVTYSDLGDDDRVVAFKDGEFTCSYQVINDLAVFDCDDDFHTCYPCTGSDECLEPANYSLGVYFRSIDLTDIFPNSIYSPNYDNRYHNIRQVGSNWTSRNAIQVIDEIQSLGDSIWQKTPQYVITLSPSMIKQIKDYNDTTTYLDYSLECGSDLHCTSEFLKKDLRDILGSKYGVYYSKDTRVDLNSLYFYTK